MSFQEEFEEVYKEEPKTLKLFVSLPMNAQSDEAVLHTQNVILENVQNTTGKKFELLNTLFHEPVPRGSDIPNSQIWYLTRSLNVLICADLVVFHPFWTQARGCIVEHAICSLYSIPHMDLSMNDLFKPEEH